MNASEILQPRSDARRGAGCVSALALSPDGRFLASARCNPPRDVAQVCLWDAATGQLLRRFAGDVYMVSP